MRVYLTMWLAVAVLVTILEPAAWRRYFVTFPRAWRTVRRWRS